MGDWRYTGFAPIRSGVPVFGVTVPLFLVSAVYIVPGIEGDGETLLRLAVFCLVVGITEESLSRGVVQRALTSVGRLPAAVWVGVLFGLGHALSGLWFGRDLGDTLFQVVSTAAFGFGYAAVRFHLTTVWPLVASHALYNFAQYASPGAAAWPVQAAVAVGFIGYGIWVLRLLDRRTEPTEEPARTAPR
nr:CPBP family intramembrane glutamic endopeptidase [Glycomyces sp. L485]